MNDLVTTAKELAGKVDDKEALLLATLLLSKKMGHLEKVLDEIRDAIQEAGMRIG